MAGRKSLRADKTPPRRSRGVKQMIDTRGFPLSTEQGAPLVTEVEEYKISEYGSANSPSIVVNSESYSAEGLSLSNAFSKADPAALPIVERFAEQSEVSRSLLGINRETTQQGLFGNVSTYGLDPKDWRVDEEASYDPSGNEWWTRRPSSTGSYYPSRFDEDEKNAAIILSSNPTPFTPPPRPSIQDQLINPGGSDYSNWGQYLNSIVALYLINYAADSFNTDQKESHNLGYLLSRYPLPNDLYWDKIWLDIFQNRFGDRTNYPIIPSGKAYNFTEVTLNNWRSNPLLWGTSNVFINEATNSLPVNLEMSWDSYFFNSTRVYYPSNRPEDKGHYRIRTNPTPQVWEKYFGIRWSELREDLKNWQLTVHPSLDTVTQVEKDLKLPYFVLNFPIEPDRINNIFSELWPSEFQGKQIDLPTNGNRIGGSRGIKSEVTLKSVRSFRYQPGRISGFTYGVKVSEIGAGPGTVLEFGIENDTDSYMFRLSNGDNFSVVRRSTVPLEDTRFLENARYGENTTTVVKNGTVQYETVIGQNIMNGDALGGEGETGYFLDPDTVTMYKIEFGWYGAIGARFYAYVPVENDQCRWVILHTLVIENQLGQPCLADPFFYFKYRLLVNDSSAIRVDQYVNKFGASYYIDGYDEGTLYSLNAQSKTRYLPSFSESKTLLNAIDWVTVMGIKPKQFIRNRAGLELYNKKEIFPENAFIYSQENCEVKIVRQKGCPEWAYSHQEGYEWDYLPSSRRPKGVFTVDRYSGIPNASLGIIQDTPSTFSAIAAYVSTVTGFRNPVSSLSDAGSQVIRIVGDDLYSLFPATNKDTSGGGLVIKLQRGGEAYLSDRNPFPAGSNIYLPFTYSESGGYEIEFDYFRRDQILLSTVDIISDEFYIFWVGGPGGGLDGSHDSTLRFGFAWPTTTYGGSDLYYSGGSSEGWGIETGSPLEWDDQKFYEGLPYDLTDSTYESNRIYVETGLEVSINNYSLEDADFSSYAIFNTIDSRINVPGAEGGRCYGLYCKSGRERREGLSIISIENDDETFSYFVSDLERPWPSLDGRPYEITITQNGVTVVATVTGGSAIVSEAGVVQYIVPITLGTLNPLLPVNVFYDIIYIATIDKKSKPLQILTSSIAPSGVPFYRAFVQGRQGAKLGGVWIGQKTSDGISVRPFTPHRSTLSITDSGDADKHGEYESVPETDGSVKVIKAYTHLDLLGDSTAPTNDSSEDTLDTYKSIHSNPRKCGSFLSNGAAGIFTESQYPLRYLTNPGEGIPLATYYVTGGVPTEIDLNIVFNVAAESIVNDDDGNLATFFIARSLTGQSGEIYMSLNYSEQ